MFIALLPTVLRCSYLLCVNLAYICNLDIICKVIDVECAMPMPKIAASFKMAGCRPMQERAPLVLKY
jgi:hypothetical protein